MKRIFFALLFLSQLTYADTFLFLHGGPGFNSEPERNLLRPQFEASGHDFIAWDEPSSLRGTLQQGYPWQNLLNSAKDFIRNNSSEENVHII
ncbi:MAG: hypothetical protein ACOCUH_04345, partial [Bacteriovoracia bacterium]